MCGSSAFDEPLLSPGDDPHAFMVNLTADGLLAAISMLVPPQSQENKDMLSLRSAATVRCKRSTLTSPAGLWKFRASTCRGGARGIGYAQCDYNSDNPAQRPGGDAALGEHRESKPTAIVLCDSRGAAKRGWRQLECSASGLATRIVDPQLQLAQAGSRVTASPSSPQASHHHQHRRRHPLIDRHGTPTRGLRPQSNTDSSSLSHHACTCIPSYHLVFYQCQSAFVVDISSLSYTLPGSILTSFLSPSFSPPISLARASAGFSTLLDQDSCWSSLSLRWSREARPAASGDAASLLRLGSSLPRNPRSPIMYIRGHSLQADLPYAWSSICALFNTNLVNLYLLSPIAGNNRVLLSSSRWLTPTPSFKNTSA